MLLSDYWEISNSRFPSLRMINFWLSLAQKTLPPLLLWFDLLVLSLTVRRNWPWLSNLSFRFLKNKRGPVFATLFLYLFLIAFFLFIFIPGCINSYLLSIDKGLQNGRSFSDSEFMVVISNWNVEVRSDFTILFLFGGEF